LCYTIGMLSKSKQQFLDELTDKERSVFLYCYVLKMPQRTSAKHLKMSLKSLNQIHKDIAIEIEVTKIQSLIVELHDMV
jgi:hypothetical protein